MKRALAWLAGLVGIAALGRMLAQRRHPAASTWSPAAASSDPAEELRRKLAGERQTAPTSSRAGGRPRGRPESLEERRARVHAKAREAIDAMDDVEDAGVTATEQTATTSPASRRRSSTPGRPRPVRPDRGSPGRRPPPRRAGPSGRRARLERRGRPPAVSPSYAWVSSIGSPVRRRPRVPRLLLEVLFLAGVATAAAIADLDAA